MIKMKVRRNHVMKNIYPFESIAFWWSEIIVATGDKKQIGILKWLFGRFGR